MIYGQCELFVALAAALLAWAIARTRPRLTLDGRIRLAHFDPFLALCACRRVPGYVSPGR